MMDLCNVRFERESVEDKAQGPRRPFRASAAEAVGPLHDPLALISQPTDDMPWTSTEVPSRPLQHPARP